MSTKKKTSKTDDEGFLIDVHPENEKKIIAKAKAYKRALIARQAASGEEVALKGQLLELIKAANLQPMEDGKIKLLLHGFKITVTPRDMLIQVVSEGEEE